MAGYKPLRQRRKPMADINVVPYIDVMLVLLIIFMITAPLLTQGVQVDLPQAVANPVESPENSEPLVISVDAEGNYYSSIGETPDEPVEASVLAARVTAVLKRNPQVPVMVKGDASANYGQVVGLMALLQQSGVPNVGLITKQPEN
ncbi:Tol biopolymer transport system, TolR protein [Methylophaga frappieri]|uniref:Tol-Pal system protein TolR n=1 Tax=Methylophaga frappieri (strain ATCC BAA-2434 / DSM 25690 / JAM7) TaxID=754477 RepID=I1YIX8_METFJ|nr:protein TolR [Methylophaga frappieri]AFJ02871.1 Tol biopolymer transport system, TolR protein [Methylophaga frappieri]